MSSSRASRLKPRSGPHKESHRSGKSKIPTEMAPTLKTPQARNLNPRHLQCNPSTQQAHQTRRTASDWGGHAFTLTALPKQRSEGVLSCDCHHKPHTSENIHTHTPLQARNFSERLHQLGSKWVECNHCDCIIMVNFESVCRHRGHPDSNQEVAHTKRATEVANQRLPKK